MERKRVLLVDDEPEIADVLRTYLEREGLVWRPAERSPMPWFS